MQAVLPGRPQSTHQAFDTVQWNDQRLIAYVSRHALIVLQGPRELLQTITFNDDTELVAVAIDAITGKIAVSTSSSVHIYKPYGHEYGAAVQWSLLFEHKPVAGDDDITCLSWGLSDEILIGGSSLTLLSTVDEARETWTRQLANPAIYATFSHDASLIASTGRHDRLVKIWRRLFVGGDDERFDTAYLLHPAAVTNVWWRRRPDQETHIASVLYTTCADHKLRVWTDVSPHCVHILELWHELDLLSCIPISEEETKMAQYEPQRLVFTIDSWDFKAMLDEIIAHAATQETEEDERQTHHRRHLSELAAKEPEICIVLDAAGTMSAWGLERVGHKARHLNDVLNIAYTEDAQWDSNRLPTQQNHVRLLGYKAAKGKLIVLANHSSGHLDWLQCLPDCLLDPSQQAHRLRLVASSTGLSAAVTRIIPGPPESDCFLTLTGGPQAHVWSSSRHTAGDLLLHQSCLLNLERAPLDAAFVCDDKTVAILDKASLSVWSLTGPSAVKLCATLLHEAGAEFLHLLARADQSSSSCRLAALGLCSRVHTCLFAGNESSAKLSPLSPSVLPFSGQTARTVFKFPLHPDKIMSIDGSNDYLQSWVLVNRTEASGEISSVDLTPNKGLHLKGKNEFRYIAPAGQHFVAITSHDENAVSIWNLESGCLEYHVAFPDHDPIKWLTWGAVTNDVSILGIVLPHKIHILCQTRLNHRSNQPPWIITKTIDLKVDTPHEAEAAVWFPRNDKTCHLVVDTVAHQMFEYSADFTLQVTNEAGKSREVAFDMVQAAAQMNSDLVVYHPAVLVELVALGRIDTVQQILAALENQLKFYTSDEALDSTLGLDLNRVPFYRKGSSRNDQRQEPSSLDASDHSDTLSASACDSLLASLANVTLRDISKDEQNRLSSLVQSMKFDLDHQNSVDIFGQQFLIEFDLQRGLSSSAAVAPMTWREIVWAQNSTSQEILLDLTTRNLDGKLSWDHARSLGIFMWVSDIDALKARFEIVARSEYLKTEERNPVDCSLHYLALGKKNALAGLWRLATWNRERAATMKLLANNFDDPRWKSAALKNAYALLGRHRPQYAAAFFLLAGSLKDCVSILTNQLGDLQLAIAVARVYEGTETAGPVLTNLIEKHVLPLATRTNEAWLAVWAFSMLGKHDIALKCLTRPLRDVIVVDEESVEPRSFTKDDPSTVYVYRCLRDKYPKAARHISPTNERSLVLAASKTYRRMGCGSLALSVARDFSFSVNVEDAIPKTLDGHDADDKSPGQLQLAESASTTSQSLNLLDEFEVSSQSNGHVSSTVITPAHATLNGVPRKVVSAEPSAASIFDNFDF